MKILFVSSYYITILISLYCFLYQTSRFVFLTHGAFNKIETQVASADIDRKYVKTLSKRLKELKDRLKKGDASVEDEIFELEDKLDAANVILTKEKEAAKAEKDAMKNLKKKSKK